MRPTRPIRPCPAAVAPATCWARPGRAWASCVDAESNGQPNGTATGDDTAVGAPVFGTCVDNDDEDGVTGLAGLVEGVASNLTIVVEQFDLFTQRLDRLQRRRRLERHGRANRDQRGLAVGTNNLSVTPPAAATQAPTFARFRCSTQSGLGSTGAAADGEVEDYTAQHRRRIGIQRLGRRAGYRHRHGHGQLPDGGHRQRRPPPHGSQRVPRRLCGR